MSFAMSALLSLSDMLMKSVIYSGFITHETTCDMFRTTRDTFAVMLVICCIISLFATAMHTLPLSKPTALLFDMQLLTKIGRDYLC